MRLSCNDVIVPPQPDSCPQTQLPSRRSPARRSPSTGGPGRRRCIAPGRLHQKSAPTHRASAHRQQPSALLRTSSASSKVFHHRLQLTRTSIPKPHPATHHARTVVCPLFFFLTPPKNDSRPLSFSSFLSLSFYFLVNCPRKSSCMLSTYKPIVIPVFNGINGCSRIFPGGWIMMS